MALADLTDRGAVFRAVRRYNELGADRFLSIYGFGPARDYLLEVEGEYYDSKAIAGVAHGMQHPELGPSLQDVSVGVLPVLLVAWNGLASPSSRLHSSRLPR